jgi:5'(3')-deoxyribonucleotidase
VDLDGVLADFDKSAEAIVGTDNTYKFEFIWGPDVFWKKLNAKPNFFRDLETMPDALYLWNAIKKFNPAILTALPKVDGERVDSQKRAWVGKRFPGTEVITCITEDKPKFCKPGDILIDDRAVNRDAWIAAGGTFIIHTSAANTVTTLRALGIID